MEAATNYPAWEAGWAPEAWWATKLWRNHKLNHAEYLALSVRLRDGHDRRKASVEAVIAAETVASTERERALAREALAATARPFRPLPDRIQSWRL